MAIHYAYSEISPKGKRKLSFQSNKPGLLKGRKFFLDIQGSGKVDNIKHTILQLGGVSSSTFTLDVFRETVLLPHIV